LHTRSGIRYEVVIVDDASPDGTQDVVHALAGVYGADTIRLAARPGKLGLGAFLFFVAENNRVRATTGIKRVTDACLITGSAYLHGLKFARGDRVVIMDADMSHHVRVSGILRIRSPND
jgi:dolichol-phosphate mannosyltransferase